MSGANEWGGGADIQFAFSKVNNLIPVYFPLSLILYAYVYIPLYVYKCYII